MPFSESFQSGRLANYWTVSGTGSNRVTINNSGGRFGSLGAILDSSAPNTYSRTELTLNLDLYWWTNVTLSFYAKSFHDEPHALPPSPFVGGADFDGAAISVDGLNWYEVQPLRSLTTNFTRFTVALDSLLASNNLSYTSNFLIRFNQYDDFPAPSDGIAIDDISVNGLLKVPLPYAPVMAVTPSAGITFTSLVNGPFATTQQYFVISNSSASNLQFTVSSTSSWFTVSIPDYASYFHQLSPNQATTATVSLLTYQLSSLPAGTYSERVVFYNSSGGAGSTTQMVSLVLISNSPPVGFSQTLTLAEDSSVPIQLDGSDPDGQPLTAMISRLPDRGTLYQTLDGINLGSPITTASTVVSNSLRKVIFVPYRHENGSNYTSFGFRMKDDRTNSPETSVVLHVTSERDSPFAVDDRVSTLPGTTSPPFDPVANDEHPDGVPLSLISFTQPLHGIVTQRPDGLLVYTPKANFLRGRDPFTYTVQDPYGQTSSAKVDAYVGVLMGGDWPMYRGGAAHTGYYPGKLGGATLQQRWLNHFSNDVGQVVAAEGNIYLSAAPSMFLLSLTNVFAIALNAENGSEKWRSSVAGHYLYSAVYNAGRVYFNSSDGANSLVAASGQPLWNLDIGLSGSEAPPTIFGDSLFINFVDSYLGIVRTNGQLRFLSRVSNYNHYSTPPWMASYYKGALYCWDGAGLAVLDPAEGTLKWRLTSVNPPALAGPSGAAVEGNRAFAVTPFSLYAIDLEARSISWSQVRTNDLSGAFRGTPLVANGVVYCLSTNGLWSFRASDGSPVRNYAVADWPDYPRGSAIVTDDSLFISTDANTYIFTLAGQLQQTIPFGGEISVSDGALLISGRDGRVTSWGVTVSNDLVVRPKEFESAAAVSYPFSQGYIVTNTGTATFSNMLFVVQFPTNVVVNSAVATQGTASSGDGYVLFLLGDIGPTASAAIDLSFTSTTNRVFVSTGRIVYPPVDAVPGNELATATTIIGPATLNYGSISVAEGDSGTSEAIFPVWLSMSYPLPVSVQYQTLPSTATPTNDYLPIQGTLTFSPGVITQTLRVPIIGNLVYEPDKLFSVSFANLSNAIYGPVFSSAIRIVNDDPPPTFTISDATVIEGNEGVKNVQFTVSCSPPAKLDLYRGWETVDGTAIAGLDFMSNSGSLFFRAGVTSQVVTVSVIGDSLVESNEYFAIKLFTQTNAAFPDATALCWILNDDGLSNAVHHFEWRGVPITQPVNTAFPVEIVAKDLFGNIVQDSQAEIGISWADLDHEVLVGTGSYAPSQSRNNYNVDRYTGLYQRKQLGTARRIRGLALDLTQPLQATFRNFTLRLKHTSLATYPVGSSKWETNGWTTVYEAAQAFTTTGWTYFAFSAPFDYNGVDSLLLDLSFFGQSGSSGIPIFRATYTPQIQALRGQITYDWVDDPKLREGPTRPAEDLLNVRFFGDESPFPNERIVLTNGNWTGLIRIPMPGSKILLRVQDTEHHEGLSDPVFSFLTNDLSVVLAHTNTNPVVGVPYTLNLVVSNSPSTTSTDVVLTNTLPLSWTVVSAVSSIGSCGFSNETVICNLGTLQPVQSVDVTIVALPSPRGVGTNLAAVSRSEPELYLRNNLVSERLETMPPVYVSITDVVQSEETNSTQSYFQFFVTLTAPASFNEPVPVFFSTHDGTATSGPTDPDYGATSGYITLGQGTNSLKILVEVYQDNRVEENEAFNVLLAGVTNAIISKATGTGTILDGDIPQLSCTNVGILEGSLGITNLLRFNVSLQPASVRPVSVQYQTYDISAKAGSDYLGATGTLVFPPGITNLTIPVPVLGDDFGETNETFGLWLGNATNAYLTPSLFVGTITNDDPATIFVSDTDFFESTGTNSFTSFWFSIAPPASNTVTVGFSTMGGSAVTGRDFAGTNGTVTFAPGQSQVNVPITILPDHVVEDTKSFFLLLTNPIGAVLARNTAQGFIHDADSPGRLYAEALLRDDTLGNWDGEIDAGETIRVWIRLRNTLPASYDGARGTLIVGPATNPPVTLLRSNSTFPLVASGEVVTNSLPYILRIGKNQGCFGAFYLSHIVEFGNSRVTNIFGFSFGYAASSWRIATADPAPQVGAGCSIEIDSLRQRHLSYFDEASHSVKHAVNDGYGWKSDVVGSAAASGTETAMGIASNGVVKVVYRDPASFLVLASSTGSNWTHEVIPDSLDGSRPSLVVTGSVSHVSFYSPGSQCLRYAAFDGSNWLSQAVECGAGGRGHFSSLALFNGMPRIAYTDGWTNGLKFASWTGVSWAITNLDTAEFHGAWPSLRLNASGEPDIAYADQEQGRVRLAEKRGNLWTNSIVPSSNLSPLGSISMRLDPQGNLYIAFLGSPLGYVGYYYRTGGVWNGDWGFNARFPLERISLALNSNNIAEVALYGPATNGVRTASRLGCSPVNTIPVAFPQLFFGSMGANIPVQLKGNDFDEDTLQWKLASNPLHGVVTNFNASKGTLNYLAAPAFEGIDTFTYQVSDGFALSQPATVTLQLFADSDGDGISDSWELAHGLNPYDPTDASQDLDGDGVPNLAEFRAQTNPEDPTRAFRITSTIQTAGFPNTIVQLQFSTEAGLKYRLLRVGGLLDNGWTPTGAIATGTGATVTLTDQVETGTGPWFYRVEAFK